MALSILFSSHLRNPPQPRRLWANLAPPLPAPAAAPYNRMGSSDDLVRFATFRCRAVAGRVFAGTTNLAYSSRDNPSESDP